jgi:hypothetical protein
VLGLGAWAHVLLTFCKLLTWTMICKSSWWCGVLRGYVCVQLVLNGTTLLPALLFMLVIPSERTVDMYRQQVRHPTNHAAA